MAQNNGYAEQIAAAKRSLETWPDWMKVNARFHGSEISKGSKESRSGEAQKNMRNRGDG